MQKNMETRKSGSLSNTIKDTIQSFVYNPLAEYVYREELRMIVLVSLIVLLRAFPCFNDFSHGPPYTSPLDLLHIIIIMVRYSQLYAHAYMHRLGLRHEHDHRSMMDGDIAVLPISIQATLGYFMHKRPLFSYQKAQRLYVSLKGLKCNYRRTGFDCEHLLTCELRRFAIIILTRNHKSNNSTL